MASDGADAALAEVQRLFAGGLTAAHSAGVRCYYCGAGGHHILLCRRLEADRESYVAHLRKRSEAKVAEGSGPVLGVREYLQTHAAFLSEAERQPDYQGPELPPGAAADAPPLASQPIFSQAKRIKRSTCCCGKSWPSFGWPGEPRHAARWCAKCPERPSGTVDVVSKRCECARGAVPSFAPPGSTKREARWCAKCPGRPLDAVDVASKRCECGKSNPSFALPGGTRKDARWCAQCPGRPANTVSMIGYNCACGKTASFGLSAEDKPLWCPRCKPAEAIVVKGGRTKVCACGKHTAMFGPAVPEGQPKPKVQWCKWCPDLPANAINYKSTARRRKREEAESNGASYNQGLMPTASGS